MSCRLGLRHSAHRTAVGFTGAGDRHTQKLHVGVVAEVDEPQPVIDRHIGIEDDGEVEPSVDGRARARGASGYQVWSPRVDAT